MFDKILGPDDRVLVVAAHPDDETLGCGGTIARLASAGHRVAVLVLGEGAMSRLDASATQVAALDAQCEAACAVLGVTGVHRRHHPDNRFDSVPLLDVVRDVETVIAEVSPALVLTHHAGDLNIDHAVVNRAVLTATRPLESTCVRCVATFETLSSTEWSFNPPGASFAPNVYVEITATLAVKQAALAKYASETAAFPHPRSVQAVEALARLRGSTVGKRACEAFCLVRAS